MLTIYHWEPNANSGKPILAAYEKGVAFESRYVDMLGFEQHEPGRRSSEGATCRPCKQCSSAFP